MPTSQKSVSAAFTKLEIDLVKGKAKGLIGKYGFSEADRPDLEQELFLEVFLKRNTSLNWPTKSATQRTVLSRILDNRIRNIIDAACSDKRRVSMHSDSLSTPVGYNPGGDPITLLDLLSEDGQLGHEHPHTAGGTIDLRIDLSLRTPALSEVHIDITVYLSEGRTVSEIAELMGMKRRTLRNRLAQLQTILEELGIGDYA